MNANRYRLIFDKRTGMLIPVAEFTPAARKGNGRGAGEGMGDTTSPKWNRMFAAMTLAAGGLGSSWSLHSQNLPLTPDGSTNTTVTQTINGTPLINIANPNNGLSHNRFTDLNVGAQGVVFNNSRVDGVSQIGGSAMKNPHLQQNATGILAEVTGTDISRLQGTMEVFGPAADLLIANPKGNSVFGDKGAYLSNTLNVPIAAGFVGFVGADVGVVQDNVPDAKKTVVSGWAVGVRGSWRNASITLTHAAPIKSPYPTKGDVLYAMASLRF
jgi:filamentous hemagglutinin family protein